MIPKRREPAGMGPSSSLNLGLEAPRNLGTGRETGTGGFTELRRPRLEPGEAAAAKICGAEH